MATSTTPFTDYSSEITYIEQRARQLGLDAGAVLAVAASEGVTLPATPGDKNANGVPTSFGPWQMHIGGKLPQNIAAQGPVYAQGWANSPAGIDYALQGIAKVAQGQTGYAAVHTIVTQFEQPRSYLVAGEVTRSYQRYLQGGKPAPASGTQGGSSSGSGGGFFDALSGLGTGVEQGLTGNPIGAALSTDKALAGLLGINAKSIPGVAQADAVTSFFGKLTDPNFILRTGEVIAGAVLILIGGVLLARQIGLAPTAPGPIQAAAGAVT